MNSSCLKNNYLQKTSKVPTISRCLSIWTIFLFWFLLWFSFQGNWAAGLSIVQIKHILVKDYGIVEGGIYFCNCLVRKYQENHLNFILSFCCSLCCLSKRCEMYCVIVMRSVTVFFRKPCWCIEIWVLI